MITAEIEYFINEQRYVGFVAYDEAIKQPKPGVLIAHDWSGRNAFVEEKAKALAALGYVGFALDMYGDGQIGQTNEQKMRLMSPLVEDRRILAQRITLGLEVMQALPQVNEAKTVAMGYCFGGMCVLDLARSGADVKGVVSVHGLLAAPAQPVCARVKAKVLALHGYDDPMVPPSAIDVFAQEMTEKKVDWQLHAYGNTQHAFANPAANDPALGTGYSAIAAERAWQATLNFFAEIVG